MKDGTLRQRRNLVLISGFLILFDFAEVSIAKVGILGTELLIGKPEILLSTAWVLWGYFLLRYYQYVREENNLGIVDGYRKCLRLLVRDKSGFRATQDEDGNIRDYIRLKRTGFLTWELEVEEINPVKGSVSKPGRVVSTLRVLCWMLRSICQIVFNTPRVTDYALPYLLALAAPIVTIWQ